jgi:hypothetical protein
MAYFDFQAGSLLSAVVVDGAGTALQLDNGRSYERLRWYVIASAVTTGATVTIEVSPDGTNWAVAATSAVSATGVTSGTIDSPFAYVRAKVASRTDGTYTVKYELTRNP